MIVEMRTYELKPGVTSEYMSIYQTYGLSVQREILGNLVGYFTSEIGRLNQVIHLWSYADFQDRQRRREELLNNSQWSTYLPMVTPLIANQTSQILKPASFSPRQWSA